MDMDEIEAFFEVNSPDIQHHADLNCPLSIAVIDDYEQCLDNPDDDFALCFLNIALNKWIIKYKL